MPHRFISDDDADRLLAGTADAGDVDAGLADLAGLLAAARQADDPQDRQAAAEHLLPQMVALVRTGGPDSTNRRSSVIHKIVTGKVAAIAAATLLTAGVAAAAAGSMPASSSHADVTVPANASKPDTPQTDESTPETGDTEAPETPDTEAAATIDTTAATDVTLASTPDSTPVGPDVTGPAQFGLCTAWSASGKPKNPDAIAFRNLIAAAGSADAVAAWCAPVLAEHEAAKTAAASNGKSGETHGKSGETHGKSGETHGKP